MDIQGNTKRQIEQIANSLEITPAEAERVAKSVWVSRMWDAIDTEEGLSRVKDRIASYRRYRRRLRIAVAASSAAAVIAVAVVLMWHRPSPPPAAITHRTIAEAATDEKITLISEDGGKYILNDLNDCIRFDESDLKIVKQGGVVKVLPAETTGIGQQNYPTPRMKISIPRGSERQLHLLDGTKVWLSAETTFSFPLYFDGDSRTVEIEGEAYFEVAHDPEKPFVVRSGDMSLRVLGTVFNIYAYPEETTIETTLLEGSVVQSFEGIGEQIVLKPAEQTLYTKYNKQVSHTKVHPEDYRAYKEGKIVFRDASAEKILLALERTYNVKIVIEKAWLKYDKYTLTVNKNETIDIPLNKLTQTGGFAYEKVDGIIRIY